LFDDPKEDSSLLEQNFKTDGEEEEEDTDATVRTFEGFNAVPLP
jgi:hypothetical protein